MSRRSASLPRCRMAWVWTKTSSTTTSKNCRRSAIYSTSVSLNSRAPMRWKCATSTWNKLIWLWRTRSTRSSSQPRSLHLSCSPSKLHVSRTPFAKSASTLNSTKIARCALKLYHSCTTRYASIVCVRACINGIGTRCCHLSNVIKTNLWRLKFLKDG